MARRLGPYSLLRQIASGGMAEIYLASARGADGSERRVALKLIHAHSADDPDLVAMLVEEARLALQLQHGNIVATYDLGHERGEYYIVMELVEGMDLFRGLQRAAERDLDFPFELAAFIAREVASGLDYAHRKLDQKGQPLHVVHRDVSPHNVLLSYAGEVKLGDFGIAKAARRAAQTQAGVIKGKYAYMSPEQAWGDPIDARTDIFSAGIILYEMLAGQMLYLEEELERLLELVRKAEIAAPGTRRKAVPRDLEQIVMKALRKRPSDRWPTAGDYAQALTDFLRGYAPDFNGAKQLGAFLERLAGAKEAPKRRDPDEPTTALPRPRSFGGPLVKDDNSLLFPAPARPAAPAPAPDDDEFGGETYVDAGPAAFLEMARSMGRLDEEEDRLGSEPTSLVNDLPAVPASRQPSPVPRAAAPRLGSSALRGAGPAAPRVLSPAPAPSVPRSPSPVPAAPRVLSPAPAPSVPRAPAPAPAAPRSPAGSAAGRRQTSPPLAPRPSASRSHGPAVPHSIGPSASAAVRTAAPQAVEPSASAGVRSQAPAAPQAVGASPSAGLRMHAAPQAVGASPSAGVRVHAAPQAIGPAPSAGMRSSPPEAPRPTGSAPAAPPRASASSTATPMRPSAPPPPPSGATPMRPSAPPPSPAAATPVRPSLPPLAPVAAPVRPPSAPPVQAQAPWIPPARAPEPAPAPRSTATSMPPRPAATSGPPRPAAMPAPQPAPMAPPPNLRPRRGGLFVGFLLAMGLGAGGVMAIVLWPQAPPRGQLEVRSAPPGALVLIDGRVVETPTPVRILDLDARSTHRVTVRQAGYRTWETEVRFEGAEQSRAVQAILEKE